MLDVGSGEPALVFLHYWGGSARSWGAGTQYLMADVRCIAYDHHGSDGSVAPVRGFTIRDLALDASEIVRALGLTRFVLIDHSMGSKVAQLLASQHPAGLQNTWFELCGDFG